MRRGNTPDPIARLYTAHAANVLGFLVRLTGGKRTEAEDLLQETFIAAFQGQARFARRGSERAWLMGIALRRWRDRQRHHLIATTAFPEDDDPRLTRDVSPIEQQVIQRIALDHALEQLPPLHREALLLVTGQGLSQKEAALILEEPVGTIKWRVFEATRLVRQYLTALEKEESGIDELTLENVSGCADAQA
jgi:RNA polymerase sigma-70 factor, ECF subfamily